jgi:hypothetical protein
MSQMGQGDLKLRKKPRSGHGRGLGLEDSQTLPQQRVTSVRLQNEDPKAGRSHAANGIRAVPPGRPRRLGSRSHRCRSGASGFAYRRFSSANEKCLFNCLLKVGNKLLVA